MAWAHDGRLLVVVHGKSSPSALEWSRFLNDNRSLRDPRILVCTYGGSPDGNQRRELMGDAFYGGVPTVVIGVAARHIHSPSSILHRDDFDHAVKLLVALLSELDAARAAGLIP